MNGTDECDDGETVDGDGCDSNCRYETWFEIAAVRKAIHNAVISPIALSNLDIHHATVSFVKPAIAGAMPGNVDGPAFFIQDRQEGPALMFAMEPSIIASNMQPGDVLDLQISEARWLACDASCTADTAMYVVTMATGTRLSTGATVPLVQDLSADTRFRTTIGTPVSPSGWDIESERVNFTGIIGSLFQVAGPGFQRATLLTDGAPQGSNALYLRVPATMVTSKNLWTGCTVTVNGTPMWRTALEPQAAAWSDGDLTQTVCPALAITNTVPANGSTGVGIGTSIAVTFSRPINEATLTAQTSAGACTGSFQMSLDEFATCLGFTSSVPNMTVGNTVATYVPSPSLLNSTTYKVKVTTAVKALQGDSLAADYVMPTGFTTIGTGTGCDGSVVISQVYGGGMSGGASYAGDYVELHNRGNTTVSLNGWSVQYASATGTDWVSRVELTNKTIPPGEYFLVVGITTTPGNPTPAALPTADASGSQLSLSGTAGKVALANISGDLPNLPSMTNIVDLVGYGNVNLGSTSQPGGYEGAGPTGALSSTTAALRNGDGCTDSDNNNSDFTVGAPTPRNSASPAVTCTCP